MVRAMHTHYSKHDSSVLAGTLQLKSESTNNTRMPRITTNVSVGSIIRSYS